MTTRDEGVLVRLARLSALGAADTELTPDAHVILDSLAQPWTHTPSAEELVLASNTPVARVPAVLAELDAHGYLARLREVVPYLAGVRR